MWDEECRKWGRGEPAPFWRELLNDDAALVQQFAGLGVQVEQVAPQSDLVNHHVGFRPHPGRFAPG